MHLLVDYGTKKYGTGEDSKSYKVTIKHNVAAQAPGSLTVTAEFKWPVSGYTYSIYGESTATVFGAQWQLDLMEAEHFATAILHAVEHARSVEAGKTFEFTFPR
jgi:hypothetical protein